MTTSREQTRLLPVADVELCVETFGDPDAPAILLILRRRRVDGLVGREVSAGALAAGGRFVLRYDHRDTGRSAAIRRARPAMRARTWSTTRSA